MTNKMVIYAGKNKSKIYLYIPFYTGIACRAA